MSSNPIHWAVEPIAPDPPGTFTFRTMRIKGHPHEMLRIAVYRTPSGERKTKLVAKLHRIKNPFMGDINRMDALMQRRLDLKEAWRLSETPEEKARAANQLMLVNEQIAEQKEKIRAAKQRYDNPTVGGLLQGICPSCGNLAFNPNPPRPFYCQSCGAGPMV